uniref:C2H2-type domain-containing protein n=1 Tax=Meloidogyne hapla TaxID=6305 RepID=A0A1I8AZJ6_MELHA
MSSNQEQRELDEENPCNESIGLRRSKRNKYHLDVAAVIKSGGCSSFGRNYSPPAKRKWASRRPEIKQDQYETPVLIEELATQQQKVSPRRNVKQKQPETLSVELKQEKINQEFERQKYRNADKQNNITEEPEQQHDGTNDSHSTDAPIEGSSGLCTFVLSLGLLILLLQLNEGLDSTETVAPTEFSQSPRLSDQSSSQSNIETKRLRKVPIRHKDYCNDDFEEDEAEEDDDEESLFKDIKVEYLLTDGIKMESIQQNCCNGIDANMRMEELRGEDSCEEPIIVISSLDEIDNSDQLVTRQLYDDDFCFAGGSNCEDAMPVLEQIITESDPLLKELTSDLERKIVKGGNKNVLYYIEQNRKREAEKKGNKRRLLNSYANLDAIAGLKHLDENSFYTKRGNSNSAKIYDRNTVHCPKCPFRTQSRLRLAPHMAGHERQDQTAFR